MSSSSNKIALFIDGANLYATAKTLGFDIDYKRLLKEFGGIGRLLSATISGNLLGAAAMAVASVSPDTCTGTLLLAWLFSNVVCAFHYTHLAYRSATTADDAGLNFPGTSKPVYWDFIYFSFTLGMTFQTSDVTISDAEIRRFVTLHALGAFVFNIGVLAFTINVLGSH